MPEIMLEGWEKGFLRALPRLITRHTRATLDSFTESENRCITRLQGLGMLRCTIDTEHSDAHFQMAELSLTDAGRALLAADAKAPGA
jgi:hypothetical protein